MNQEREDAGKQQDYHKGLRKIWERSRTRAFAHQISAERYQEAAENAYAIEMRWSKGALLLLIFGLSISTEAVINAIFEFTGWSWIPSFLSILASIATILSAMASICGLFHAVTSQIGNQKVMEARHRMSVQIFMALSQKTRMPVSGLLSDDDIKYLVFHYDQFLAILFAVGENPTDADYREAHELFSKLDPKNDKSEVPDYARVSFEPEFSTDQHSTTP